MPAAFNGATHPDTDWIPDVLRRLDGAARNLTVRRIRADHSHSNDIFELTLCDGRTLLLKRARHEWLRPCFTASATAARLISASSELVVPQPLPLPDLPEELPVQAYWRISLPTLAQLWPDMTAERQAAALRSLGALTRRLHTIAAPGWGPLHRCDAECDLAGDLHRDLRQRLLPAVIAHWPAGIAALERLIQGIPTVQQRWSAAAEQRWSAAAAALVHADLHLGNVLCRVRGGHVHCVGFLDLDGAAGGTAEADVACFDVLHGPLFQRHIHRDLRLELRRGYGPGLDDQILEYYRCAHLGNQGFSSALLGHEGHAADIAAELDRRMGTLFSGGTGVRRRTAAAARYWQ
jgi:Ser/Thr protein kinase RdoA (MazF antagonist)